MQSKSTIAKTWNGFIKRVLLSKRIFYGRCIEQDYFSKDMSVFFDTSSVEKVALKFLQSSFLSSVLINVYISISTTLSFV